MTIQNHKGGIKRELDELKQADNFLKLLEERTGIGKQETEEQRQAISDLITRIADLQQAITESQIGFVGASILITYEEGKADLTLIDVENCVLPEDPGVDSISIENKKISFCNGLETLKWELSKKL